MSADGATTTPDPDTPPTPAPNDGSLFGVINKEVADTLTSSNPSVREGVVKALVDEKLEERKRQCLRAVALIREFKGKINKIKPANKQLELSGKVIAESYTDAQVKEHRGHKEHVDRLEQALKEAFDKANYDPLTKAIAKAEGKADKEEKPAE